LHVVDVPGKGPLPPIVLLHGLSASAADYAPLFRRLRPFTRRLIAPDLPGHGLSAVPPGATSARAVFGAVRDALDQVLTEPAIVFGNSLGGTVAIRFALAAPRHTAGLFLVSPAGAPDDGPEWQSLMDLLRMANLEQAREFMRRVFPSNPRGLELLARGAQVRLSRPGVRRLIDEAEPADLLSSQELASLAMPTVLVWGRRERLLPISHREFFMRHMPPHVRFITPPLFGHAPFLDRPDDVAALVRQFAIEVSRRSSTRRASHLGSAALY
jgi:pimeloyl-ACP methyl ester carboxylesterase